MFWIPWAYLFQKRPALHQVPQNSNLAVLGFQRLGKTIVALRTDYKPVTTFLLAVSFTEAAVNAFTTIAITYATVVLEMTGSESGGMIGICLVFAVPGSIIFGKVTKRIGVYKSYLASLLYWAFVTTIAPFFMSSPKHKANAYLFGILWGIGFGWVYPTQRTAYCLIIPAGQESELMGIYIFAGQVIVWLPPLIFAVLNENHISMKWGLVSDAAFFVIGFLICYSIGDFAAAEDKAKETAHKRVMPPVARRNSAIELNDNPEYQEEVGGNGDNQL